MPKNFCEDCGKHLIKGLCPNCDFTALMNVQITSQPLMDNNIRNTQFRTDAPPDGVAIHKMFAELKRRLEKVEEVLKIRMVINPRKKKKR